MARQKQQQEGSGMSGIERLELRISSMINHPIAQQQRWVTIHRLDTDGEREWGELMRALSETDGLEMAVNDEDESVTLQWEALSDDDPRAEHIEEFTAMEEPAPF